MKQRIHREWFRAVSLGNRKSCPSCGSKLDGESIWSWGEYHNVKWRTVKHFCKQCWPDIQTDLRSHKGDCGCTFELMGYGGTRLPYWLKL